MSSSIITRPAEPGDVPAISELHAQVFGPGRFARTAYRVREGQADWTSFCRVALQGRRIIAALRFSPITIGGVGEALLLGPLVVAPEFAGQGFGRRLIAEGLEAARAQGIALVLLVGDEPYYGRLGFKHVPPGQITLPGPVSPMRLLAAELKEGALGRTRGLVAGVL